MLDLGFRPGHRYVNAGVLVMDLDAWRRERISDQLFAFVSRHGERLFWHDQDALNVLLQGRITLLPRRWNVQTLWYTALRPHAVPQGVPRDRRDPPAAGDPPLFVQAQALEVPGLDAEEGQLLPLSRADGLAERAASGADACAAAGGPPRPHAPSRRDRRLSGAGIGRRALASASMAAARLRPVAGGTAGRRRTPGHEPCPRQRPRLGGGPLCLTGADGDHARDHVADPDAGGDRRSTCGELAHHARRQLPRLRRRALRRAGTGAPPRDLRRPSPSPWCCRWRSGSGRCCLAGPIAGFYGSPELARLVSSVASLGFFAIPFASPLLWRCSSASSPSARWRSSTSRGDALNSLVTVSLALLGHGPVSYVWGYVASSVFLAAAAVAMRPRLRRSSARRVREARAHPGLRRGLHGRRARQHGQRHAAAARLREDPRLRRGRPLRPGADRLSASRPRASSRRSSRRAAGDGRARPRRRRPQGELSPRAHARLRRCSGRRWCCSRSSPIRSCGSCSGAQWTEAAPLVRIVALAMTALAPALMTFPLLVATGRLRDALLSTSSPCRRRSRSRSAPPASG